MMFDFTAHERTYYRIAKDADGNEVLIGLSREDTVWMVERNRKFALGIRDHAGKRRAVELRRKYEAACFAADELKNTKPTRQ